MMFSVNLTMTQFTRALRAERFCWVPIDLQRPLYLSMNIVLLLIQGIGNIITVSTTNIAIIKAGTKIGIAIFVVQLVFWLFTLTEHTYITIRLRRGMAEASKAIFPNWKYWSQLFGLAVSIIALGRNMVRLTMSGGIEFLLLNEWPSYAFDGYQMAVVLGAWAIWYLPGKCRDAFETTSQAGIPILHTSDSRDSRDSRDSSDRRARRARSRQDRMQRRDERPRRESYEIC